MKIRQLVEILETLAPSKLAQTWDNTGISFGDLDKEISKVMVALEPSEVVIDQAIELGVDMLITHHPLIFKPIGSLTYDSLIGRKIIKLAQNDITAFSMHTNMDVSVMAQESADILGLKDVKILEVTHRDMDSGAEKLYGFGSIGYVKENMSLVQCVKFVKEKLNIQNVRVIGDINKQQVRKIAILPGSGKSFINHVIQEDVDVLITGDIDYHCASDARDLGISIIDAGHFETEYFFVKYMKEFLTKTFDGTDDSFIKIEKAVEQSPFIYI